MSDSSAPHLSLCMIVRDEERRLADCLASVRDLAGECLVVDTGSVDRSIEIARGFGARVIQTEWHSDFAAARNIGLDEATGRWILVLDADESLPASSRDGIAQLIAAPAVEAYRLVICNSGFKGIEGVQSQVVRLFPNHPLVRFEQPIHEHVNAALRRVGIPIRDTPIEINHSGYAQPEDLSDKRRRNTAIIEEAFRRDPNGDPHLRYYFAGTWFERSEWLRAASEYEECARITRESRTLLAAAARVKAAECHMKTGDTERALEHLPRTPDPSHHPLALVLRASIENQRGNSDEARRWFEAILGVPDIAFVPPVAVAPLKLKALGALGDFWAARGRKDLGVQILRLAIAFQRKIIGSLGSDVLLRYAAIIGAAAPQCVADRSSAAFATIR